MISAIRRVPTRTQQKGVADVDTSGIVDQKVRFPLNELTAENFNSISDRIIAWVNKSENETDAGTLTEVTELIFERAIDETLWSKIYAWLCRKMAEMISPKVQDDGTKNAKGKPITGGQLFRKYLLTRCRQDFECG
ncbi:hypothetical protein EDC04DRAFT_2801976 [Pisolithus marmoratus]|nr:hypothetical protein EDC04DRAFT_2801976 [Pisolithus marmoratus]